MTRTVGRIAHPDRDVQWIREERGLVEYAGPEVNGLDRIGASVRAINREQLGLVQAIRHARAQGFTWAKIGVILGVTRQAAQQRFGYLDEQLRREKEEPPTGDGQQGQGPVKVEIVELAPVPTLPPPEPEFDFSAMAALTNDEIITMAADLPKDTKMFDPYLRALREAIVVTLYKRDVSQRRIAVIIGKSTQRVSQLINAYYERMELVWQQERQDRRKKD